MTSPVLDTSATPIFPAISAYDTNPAGITVAQLVVDGSITDADGAIEAIAVTLADTPVGTWQYSIDGGATWQDMHIFLGSNAVLLDASARIRLLPNGRLSGEAYIKFAAWDKSDGFVSGSTEFVDSGATSVSTARDTASIAVTGANEVARFNIDAPGTVTYGIGSHLFGTLLAPLADGRILAGLVTANYVLDPTIGDAALMRFSADGSIDASFGSRGLALEPLGPARDSPRAIAVLPDGKIVIVGSAYNGGFDDIGVARLNADGSPDTSFDGDGHVLTAIGTRDDRGNGLIVQPDGKIVVGGSARIPGGTGTVTNFALVRYNTNGSLDTSFDADGKLTTSFGAASEIVNALALQADGKILAVGQSGSNSLNSQFALARYNADGSLDSTFGAAGKVLTSFAGVSSSIAKDVLVQPDGKILVVGRAEGPDYSTTIGQLAMARYNPNGSLDTSFSGDGKLTVSIVPSGSWGYAVAMQADGKIVVAGTSATPVNLGEWDLMVCRFNPDGTPDTSFGVGGFTTSDLARDSYVGHSDDIAYDLLIQADGRIVVVGQSFNGLNYDAVLARYNTDGTLDASFGGNPAMRYVMAGPSVVLETNAWIYDQQLGSLNAGIGNYAGATLTLAREGGADADDHFAAKAGGTLGALTQGGNLIVDSVTIGTVTTNSAGQLALVFNANATQILVNSALRQLAYSNSEALSQPSIRIDWTFSDGNTGAQGSGGALATHNYTTIDFLAIINGTAGNDSLTGGAGADSISGLEGNDTLIGAGGNDTLDGGAGNDRAVYSGNFAAYTVSAQAGTDDLFIAGPEGNDRLHSIEILQFADRTFSIQEGTPAAEALSGNDTSDLIRGRDGNDTVSGGGGDDALYGDEGIDSLAGGTGNDLLDGGTGADSMAGGVGDDTYVVDSALDVIDESQAQLLLKDPLNDNPGGGVDTVIASINYSLGSFLENLTLTGAALTGGGNALANVLTGNANNNAFTGNEGNDTIEGGSGLDTALFAGNRSQYTLNAQGDAMTVSSTAEGNDTLTHMERVQFADARVAIDMQGAGGLAAKLVGTIFGPTAVADTALVGQYIAYLDAGLAADEAASIALASARFAQVAGSHSNLAFVNTVYQNVVGSAPDAATRDLVVYLLDAGWFTQPAMAVLAANNALELDAIAFNTLAAHGLAYAEQSGTANTGGDGNDTLTGTSAANVMFGRGGNDVLTGLAGNDVIVGGAGVDRAVYTTAKSASTVTHNDLGLVVTTGAEVDQLMQVERITYSNISVAYDLTGNAATAAKLVGAIFGVSALQDEALVGQYLALLDAGATYENAVESAVTSTRFGTEAGSHSDAAFVDRVYFNIAGFRPDTATAQQLVGYLQIPGFTQAHLGMLAAEVDFNVANVNLAGLAQTGLEYTVV